MIEIPPYQPPTPEPIRWQDEYPKGFDPEAVATERGYEIPREFRVPGAEDHWLSKQTSIIQHGAYPEPRLIIRKRKVKKYLLRQLSQSEIIGPFCSYPLKWRTEGRFKDGDRYYQITEVAE